MKIRYSKSRVFLNGTLGATCAIFGALKAFEGTADFVHYVQLILGVLLVFSFFVEVKFGYLTIVDGKLSKYAFSWTTLDLDKVTSIKSQPGRIKLATPEKNLSINTSVIDKESIRDLYRELGSLQLDRRENPFTGWSNTVTIKQ
ncbi:hypothetical protein [Salinimicrobium sp. HB62]|uniref:hypothetical protein n=1 Tax=Salinimicrobium sp. HB62 TaxID=3077781 RepID=UPI002D778B91|nr:hypothetical protein [Salinimicrobium sp. HB62]